MNITLFYSWQSDIPLNKKGIHDALREASSAIESQLDDLTIQIDQATSNAVGSLHIPTAIFQNIANSDIFICDLTIIGKSTSGRVVSNPNVLIELGYAIAKLSWNRVIILFDKQYGDFTDLPFDIEKRCCVDFKFTETEIKSGVGQLRTELIARIAEIIKTNPPKPTTSGAIAEIKKREHDIKMLSEVLDLFRLNQMDYFFKNGYHVIDEDIVKNQRQFTDLTMSKRFHLFDSEARKLVLNFAGHMNSLPELLKSYSHSRGLHYSHKGYATSLQKPDPKRFDAAKDFTRIADESYTLLINYIRDHYHEINIEEYTPFKDEEEEN